MSLAALAVLLTMRSTLTWKWGLVPTIAVAAMLAIEEYHHIAPPPHFFLLCFLSIRPFLLSSPCQILFQLIEHCLGLSMCFGMLMPLAPFLALALAGTWGNPIGNDSRRMSNSCL